MKRINPPTYKLIDSEPIIISFMTQIAFSALVEAKAKLLIISLLESIQLICEEKRIEFESVKSLLTKTLKTKITEEAKAAHLLKK